MGIDDLLKLVCYLWSPCSIALLDGDWLFQKQLAVCINDLRDVMANGELFEAYVSVAIDIRAEERLAVQRNNFELAFARNVHLQSAVLLDKRCLANAARSLVEACRRNFDKFGAFRSADDCAATDSAHVNNAEGVHVALYKISVTRTAELVHVVIDAFKSLALVCTAVDANRIA